MNIKKVCIYGTESTGKSTLTIMLAKHYKTDYVPEMAREIISDTEKCTMEDLLVVAELHAYEILKRSKTANRFLFVDTDLLTTRSYAKFLFDKFLTVPKWVQEANNFDLYFYLENDVPFVQDGVRLVETSRNQLALHHLEELYKNDLAFERLSGTWNQRFQNAVSIINSKFG